MAEKEAKRGADLVDRISELPQGILHVILSLLDTKDVCRASMVSKFWGKTCYSFPDLDFRWEYFKYCKCYPLWRCKATCYDDETVGKFVRLIERTMERYSHDKKHIIRKLNIEFPKVDEKYESFLDRWIGIAVGKHVEELNIKILGFRTHDEYSFPGILGFRSRSEYRLPEILFCAKSLKVLKCDKVNLPYYETMELPSLESLTLALETIDKDMLQRIISVCPLIELELDTFGLTAGLDKLSLPWLQSNVKTSSLRKFVYGGDHLFRWPWNINVCGLTNLRNVVIECAAITDDIVYKMTSGLVGLEILVLSSCSWLRHLQIKSISLKEFHIIEGLGLEKVTIDAPNLLEFWYNAPISIAQSLVRVDDHCNAQFIPSFDEVDVPWCVRLKKFLIETNSFKVVVMDFDDCDTIEPIEILEKEFENIVAGSPYKLRELKLCGIKGSFCDKPQLAYVLDGLFRSCHPDVLSISKCLLNQKSKAAKLIRKILRDNVECSEHPLKSVEVEGGHLSCSDIPFEREIRFKLSWYSYQSEAR